jgi:UDP-N-acetylglucosamine/UDP-N-acetylgalactosamine diphosphorylase
VAHQHFGLPASDVIFFDQGWLPPLSPASGAMVLASRCALAAAPDGNGGVFAALRASGCLADMAARGAAGAYVYCVDNALVRVGDPALVGFCRAKGAAAGAKVVPRAGPAEAVGVFCADRATKALRVVEYTELPPALAAASDPDTGALRFNAANVALHYFSLPFLRRCCGADAPRKRKAGEEGGDVAALPYHAALKKVPCVADASPSAPNALKLEAFIFDVYPAAGADVALLEGVRSDDFAPVKNAEGAGRDSPDTARALLCAQHRRWAQAAGATVEGEGLFEIAAALTYAGEGLEAMKGRTYTAPCHVEAL